MGLIILPCCQIAVACITCFILHAFSNGQIFLACYKKWKNTMAIKLVLNDGRKINQTLNSWFSSSIFQISNKMGPESNPPPLICPSSSRKSKTLSIMVRLYSIFFQTKAEIVFTSFFYFVKNLKKQKNGIWVKWVQIAKQRPLRRKLDIATVGVITRSKIEMCSIPQKKMKICIRCFQTKKTKLIETTQGRANCSPLKPGRNRQKS